jgi:hypothetical protein
LPARSSLSWCVPVTDRGTLALLLTSALSILPTQHGYVRYGIIPGAHCICVCMHLLRRLTLARLSVAAGAFPTRSLRNLQRMYGLLPGINVAVKGAALWCIAAAFASADPRALSVSVPAVPPRGVRTPIRVLGVYGDTVGRMTRSACSRDGCRARLLVLTSACLPASAEDIPVCGGGFIHILDDVVLPYKL